MKTAAIYFGIVFGTGFLLGPMRLLWLVPKVGVRAAELMEMPLMLLAIFFAARFTVRRFPDAPALRTGLIALALLLAAEISLGMALTGASLTQVLLDRDPVSGTAYYASLVVFAGMPWWIKRSGLNPPGE